MSPVTGNSSAEVMNRVWGELTQRNSTEVVACCISCSACHDPQQEEVECRADSSKRLRPSGLWTLQSTIFTSVDCQHRSKLGISIVFVFIEGML